MDAVAMMKPIRAPFETSHCVESRAKRPPDLKDLPAFWKKPLMPPASDFFTGACDDMILMLLQMLFNGWNPYNQGRHDRRGVSSRQSSQEK